MLRPALALVLAAAFTPLASAQVHVPQATHFGSTTPVVDGKFGSVLALDGDVAAIGRIGFDADVQVFRRRAGTWTFEASLRSSSGDPFEGFGSALAFAGDRLFVGARHADGAVAGAGAVYVFEKRAQSWVETQKVFAPVGGFGVTHGAVFGAAFGSSLAASETSLVVGAPFIGVSELFEGAVYSYRNIGGTWTFEAQLPSPDPSFDGGFGASLDLVPYSTVVGEESLVVAAPGERDGFRGRVYVFRRIGGVWVADGILIGPDSAESDRMGTRVAASGDVVAASSLVHSTPAVGGGAVYVFRRGLAGWAFEQKLTPTDPHEGDTFGRGLDLEGDHLVAGAPNAPVDAGPGQLTHFHHDGATWVEAHRWIADPVLGGTTVLDNTWLGYSVALSGDQVLAGAARAFTAVPGEGLIYTFDVTPHALEATPKLATTNEPVTLTWSGGSPGGLAALILRKVNGAPVNALLHTGAFDAQGAATFTAPVPPGLAGLTLTFEAGGHHDLSKTLAGSNLVDVLLQ